VLLDLLDGRAWGCWGRPIRICREEWLLQSCGGRERGEPVTEAIVNVTKYYICDQSKGCDSFSPRDALLRKALVRLYI
jgi:hypothetical protein